MNNKIFEIIGSGWFVPQTPEQIENLECRGGHLDNSGADFFVYSLFFKIVLFTIHYFILLFIKKDIYSLFLGPPYSLIIKLFAH